MIAQMKSGKIITKPKLAAFLVNKGLATEVDEITKITGFVKKIPNKTGQAKKGRPKK